MKMKNALLIVGMTLTVSSMFAQGGASSTPASSGSSITSKKGEMYLPQAGDWSISMDASPFLTYFGNFFHGNGTTGAPYAAFLNQNQTIVGKYFVDDNTAYRGLLRIGFHSNSNNEEISSSDTSTAFPRAQVEDQQSISSHFIGLGVGMEKRRGSTRLQGYYGAEIMFSISSAGNDTTFTYGNSYNSGSNPTPSWYNPMTGATEAGLPRITQWTSGSTFGINLVGFIGFEYFFAPKISIGGEYTWGIMYQSSGQGSYSVEEINPKTGKDQTDSYKTGGNSGFSVDSGINSVWGNSTMGAGNLYLNFHF